jgi:hypothetical protein
MHWLHCFVEVEALVIILDNVDLAWLYEVVREPALHGLVYDRLHYSKLSCVDKKTVVLVLAPGVDCGVLVNCEGGVITTVDLDDIGSAFLKFVDNYGSCLVFITLWTVTKLSLFIFSPTPDPSLGVEGNHMASSGCYIDNVYIGF